MSPLDIILTNIVSYMGGILTGLFINYKIKQKNKEKNKDKDKDKDKRELEHNNISPIPTAPAYPVTPPLALNPEYVSNKPVTKLIFSTE
tara:strand:- start:906 stop:1172 length:267 start_codon:yes stop_codon:yes gene_type:complete